MHDIIQHSEFEKAMNAADPRIVDFILNLDQMGFVDSLVNQHISQFDAEQIQLEAEYVALGLTPKAELLDNIVLNTDGDEALISLAAEFVDKKTLNSILDIIERYPINQSRKATEKTPNDVSLMSIINDPQAQPSEFSPSRAHVLDEIENPTETVKPADFALPKSKPITIDVLKDLAEKMGQKQVEDIPKEEDLSGIVDPFKEPKNKPLPAKIESSVIFSNDPSIVPTPTTEASKIQGNFDAKLNSVTATGVKESFKVADTGPKHDPYREAVEL